MTKAGLVQKQVGDLRQAPLIFMGTPAISASILEAILDAGFVVAAVYSQPARPAGRGKALRKSPVQLLAEARGVPVETPLNFHDPESLARFRSYDASLAVVVAYGLLLPSALLALPRFGCVNIHASLLPRWRGAAPLERALQAGDPQTGLTLMQMDAGLDTGPIIELPNFDPRIDLGPEMDLGTLQDLMQTRAAEAIVYLLKQKTWQLRPQPSEGATYAQKIKKAEAQINWHQSAQSLVQHIHAFSPAPGAFCFRGQGKSAQRLKILRARGLRLELEKCNHPSVAMTPGRLITKSTDPALFDPPAPFQVACGPQGQDRLALDLVQPAGKDPMDAAAYLRGRPLQDQETL